MYFSKETVTKAYLVLSKATPTNQNNFSAIQYFVATDRFFKKNNAPCDSSNTKSKSEFYHYVEDVIVLDDGRYLSSFKTIYEGSKNVSSTVSSNFFSGSSVEHSNNTPNRKFDYPKKGALIYAMDGKVFKEEAYYSNLSDYLRTDLEKAALAIWLLRKTDLPEIDNPDKLREALILNYSQLLVDTLLPHSIDWNTIYNSLSLSLSDEVAFIGGKDIVPSQNKSSIEISFNTTKYKLYLAAIKTKPFLLLAGISGTGKSRIVRELAHACWDEGSEEHKAQKPRNFEMVQVKPNWHDSSELIGYVSRVSGKPVYVAGDFLKFVARAWEEPDIPYFLCLDEMNLAPVEQYFAEYLSVVESRKADENGVITTDPILKKNKDDWYRVLTSELTDDDEVRNRFLEDGVCIPQNLIVVGTVNMDETTFSFSRKVLDRAMTIEMNEVDLNGGLDSKHERIGKLGAAELIGMAVEGVDVYGKYKDVCDKAISYLQKINEKLEGTPFKIAYRTRNEFLLYVVNNLPYNKDYAGKEIPQQNIINRALDEITSMKILSRIEGDSDKVGSLLDDLEKVIEEQLGEQYDKEKSVSLKKLVEMKKRLASGYTSFWS